jgi:Asp-tRNA(Asn)/Glu-tRNA(Gln) amidotransferase A subunit family amidase
MTQAGLLHETNSNLWGRALNPWNVTRTTGGSSGGDSGLVSSRCVPITMGADFVRIK